VIIFFLYYWKKYTFNFVIPSLKQLAFLSVDKRLYHIFTRRFAYTIAKTYINDFIIYYYFYYFYVKVRWYDDDDDDDDDACIIP